MVFQAYSLFPHLTVARQRRVRAQAARQSQGGSASPAPARCSSWSGCPRTRTSTPASCPAASSSGSRWPGRWRSSRRVLLLDEPLSALDAKVRVQLRDEIRRVQLEVGTTTLFVTHDQEEALAVADRVGVMSQGRLEQLAAARRALRRPGHAVRRRVRRPEQQGARRGFGRSGPRCSARRCPTLAGSIASGAGWRWCGRSR